MNFKFMSLRTASTMTALLAFVQIFLVACSEGMKLDLGEMGEEYPEITANGKITQRKILLRTQKGNFISAEGGGGKRVLGTPTDANADEAWVLYDLNGGTLDNGDAVVMRSRRGHYMTAVNTGGAALTTEKKYSMHTSVFTFNNFDRESGTQRNDEVGLQAPNGQFVSAVGGGGSAVRADKDVPGLPETFSFGIVGEQIPTPPGNESSGGEKATGSLVNFQLNNGQYLAAENGGGARALGNGGSNSRWTLVDTNGGAVESGDVIALQTPTGFYLTAEGGGGHDVNANRTTLGAWEQFQIVDLNRSGAIQNGDSVALKSVNGPYVVAEGGGGQVINANRDSAGPWETFVINGLSNVPVVTPPTPTPTNPPATGNCFVRLSQTRADDAIYEAASWVRNNRPEFFTSDDRGRAYVMMTVVINILRHNGHNVGRALSHPSLPPSDPYRWGSDALAYSVGGNNWRIIDIYVSWPSPGNPNVLDHGVGTNGEITSDLIGLNSGTRCQ